MTRGDAVKRSVAYYPEHIERLATVIGGGVSDEMLKALEEVAATYHAHQNSLGKMPKSRIEEYLNRLRKALASVEEVVGNEIPYDVEVRIPQPISVKVDLKTNDKVGATIDFAEKVPLDIDYIASNGVGFKERLQTIVRQVDHALENTKTGKSGKKPDYPLVYLIASLSDIYNKRMGRSDRLIKVKAEFLQACLKPLGITLSSDQLRKRYRQANP
jgi:hypothetical protein